MLGQPELASGSGDFWAIWKENEHAIVLELDEQYLMTVRFYFFPGPENPRLARLIKNSSQKRIEDDNPIARLKKHIIESAGMRMTPIDELVQGSEKQLLEELSGIIEDLYTLDGESASKSFRLVDEPRRAAIIEALNSQYSRSSKQRTYEHFLEVAEGRVAGLSSGRSQVGATLYLVFQNDVATIPFLLQATRVGLPSGVSSSAYHGLARLCEGEFLGEVLDMLAGKSRYSFIEDPKHTATSIIEEVRDKTTYDLLMNKYKSGKYPDVARDLKFLLDQLNRGRRFY